PRRRTRSVAAREGSAPRPESRLTPSPPRARPAAAARPKPPNRRRRAMRTRARSTPIRSPAPPHHPSSALYARAPSSCQPAAVSEGGDRSFVVVEERVARFDERLNGRGGLGREVDEPDAHAARAVDALESGIFANPAHLGLDRDRLGRARQRELQRDPLADLA